MIKRLKTDNIIIFDLEMCCWDDGRERNTGEIIEIGLCQINTKNLEINKVAQYYVRPESDEVSQFCTDLTGITPKIVQRQGRPLNEVLATIKKNFGSSGKVFMAWGQDDKILLDEINEKGIEFEMGDYVNAAALIRILTGKDRNSQIQAMAEFGLEFEGSQHSGVDDAKNLARLIIEVMKSVRSCS